MMMIHDDNDDEQQNVNKGKSLYLHHLAVSCRPSNQISVKKICVEYETTKKTSDVSTT